MIVQLSEAQGRALQTLSQCGGEGVIDKFGRLLARGSLLPFDAATWLRLVTFGHLEADAPYRLIITRAGREALLDWSERHG